LKSSADAEVAIHFFAILLQSAKFRFLVKQKQLFKKKTRLQFIDQNCQFLIRCRGDNLGMFRKKGNGAG